MENPRKILLFVGSALATAYLVSTLAPDANAGTASTEQRPASVERHPLP